MPVLGDSPMFFFNTIGENLSNGLTGDGGSMFLLGIFAIAILAYIALSFKLDRGALAFIGLMGVGLFIQLEIIPVTIFWLMIAIVALVAAYGFLNSTRQGEG